MNIDDQRLYDIYKRASDNDEDQRCAWWLVLLACLPIVAVGFMAVVAWFGGVA